MTNSLIPLGTRSNLFDGFRKEVDSLMERVFEGSHEGGRTLSYWTPRINLSETETAYELLVDLPGMQPEEFNLELKNGDLWITGERKGQFEDKGRSWHRVEQFYGQFRRVIRLGEDVDAEHVDAEYKDGVLRITVPKAESARTRHITVRC